MRTLSLSGTAPKKKKKKSPVNQKPQCGEALVSQIDSRGSEVGQILLEEEASEHDLSVCSWSNLFSQR